MTDTTNNQEVLEKILSLLESAIDGVKELLELQQTGDVNASQILYTDLEHVVVAVKKAYYNFPQKNAYDLIEEMIGNIQDTLSRIKIKSIETDDVAENAMLLEFELFPLFRQLREDFYFWYIVYPDKDKMDEYYQNEFAAHYCNLYAAEKNYKYNVSIVIPAYNHLEATKQCVNSVLKNTDFANNNYELILIDHGSNDGTWEFFKSLHVPKTIRFRTNVRMKMFTIMAQICESPYFTLVSNDTIVTKNWLDLLLKCVKSDSKIISATPILPNTSNLQSLALPYQDCANVLKYAETHNWSNPQKWADRARMMPVIALYNTENVNQVGYADPYFFSMEYWDDDFSRRARRAGFRQILCGDVFCYHIGSMTSTHAKKKENTLVYGRELFQLKNHVDPWGNGFCYDYQLLSMIAAQQLPTANVKVLGIDCGFGDSLLQIRNLFRENGISTELVSLTSSLETSLDLEKLSDEFVLVDDICRSQDIRNCLPSVQFDYILFSLPLEEYPYYKNLLNAIWERLATGGKVVFYCTNPFYAKNIADFLNLSLSGESLSFLAVNEVQSFVEKLFSKTQIIRETQVLNGLDKFISAYFKGYAKPKELKTQLSIKRYCFLCTK